MSNDFTPSTLTAAPDQFVPRCKLMLLFCSLLIAVTANAQERIYPRPILVPVPGANAGDSSKIVSLSGAWQWHSAPQGEYWLPGSGDAGWVATTVPEGRRGERPEGIYAYRKRILIPASFTGQQAILRFEGVSNKARLVEGPGTIAGVDNVNLKDAELYVGTSRKAWHGRAMVVIKSGREAGNVRLKVSSPGLSVAELAIWTEEQR